MNSKLFYSPTLTRALARHERWVKENLAMPVPQRCAVCGVVRPCVAHDAKLRMAKARLRTDGPS